MPAGKPTAESLCRTLKDGHARVAVAVAVGADDAAAATGPAEHASRLVGEATKAAPRALKRSRPPGSAATRHARKERGSSR